jgi:hypothetical protein
MREDGHESTLRRIVVMTSKLPKSVVSLDKILLFQYYEELNCNDDGRNNWYIGRFSCPNTYIKSKPILLSSSVCHSSWNLLSVQTTLCPSTHQVVEVWTSLVVG